MAYLNREDTKLVNVYTKAPIRGMSGMPIRSTTRAIKLSVADIHACIVNKASVEEILIDGSTVLLTFTNYNKDNNEAIRIKNNLAPAVEPTPIVEKKKAASKKKTENPAPDPVPEEKEEESPVVEETVEEATEEEPIVEETTEEVVTEATEETPAPKKKSRRKSRQ